MTPPLRSVTRRVTGLGLAAALLSVCLPGGAGARPAQDDAPKVSLLLSYQPGDKAPKRPGEDPRFNYLRPNVQQEVFLYVKNDDAQARVVTVQVLAAGNVADEGAVKVGA